MRTIVFDLDGTLVDTSHDLIAAANACFAARGLDAPLNPLADASTAFRGGRAMLTLGHTRAGSAMALVEEDYPLFIDHYARDLAVESRPYPGALAAVERLRMAGHRTAICTNKPERLARDLLDALKISSLFDALIGADTLPVRKPDPAPFVAAVERAGGAVAQSLLIGDTETDRETARAAGVPSVLVTFGPDGRAVETLAPEATLDSYDQLDAAVKQLLG